MSHLLDIIGNQLSRYVQGKLADEDLWYGQYSQIEKTLNEGINVCHQWEDICHKLTSMYWQGQDHAWEGQPFSPEYCKKVCDRLSKILSLRTLHKQITRLLSSSEQEELKTSDAFKPFAGLKPLQYNPYTEPLWEAAVSQFGNCLKPAEQRVSGKLRNQLRGMNTSAYQLMQEFKRYMELIKRENIMRELVGEREMLLGELTAYVKNSHAEFSNTSVNGPRRIHDVPEVVNNIYWVKPLHAKRKTADSFLSDLSGYDDLKKSIREFCVELEDYHTEQFDSWSREMQQRISNQELSLATDSPVLSFNKSRQMSVNYNRRLVGLVREIANFHNTIGDQMIPSQRPMMLEAALALSNLVEDQTSITWSSTDELEKYISKLKEAVYRLSKENKNLARCHSLIKDRVLTLMNTDLLRHQPRWKELLKEIRSIMHQLEQQGFSDQKSWATHWDRQLYKALEYQYQLGVEALNHHLPEIKVELTYRQQKLQFNPPIEEIRMKYYGQLKRFLAIPYNFKGVNEANNSSIFPTIIDRNAHRFDHLFQKAEELFNKLESVKDRYIDLTAIGSRDVEVMIKEHCSKAEDWDKNFKASKAKGQEIGRLPSTDEKVDCFSISLQPLRFALEIMNRRYWDVLAQTLYNSIVEDMNQMDKLADEGIEILKTQPQTVDEIAETKKLYMELTKKIPGMESTAEEAEKKNRVLLSWTKERVEKLVQAKGKWDNFRSLMGNHENIVTKQIEGIKMNLESQVGNFNGELERFLAKWNHAKPKESILEGDSFSISSCDNNDKRKAKRMASKLQNNGESTPVTVRLLQELQKYKTIIPVLKFVRGDMFSEKHWIEMYNLIGIPSSVPVESLTFGHFIQVKDQILEKSEELKDLNFRASGEVVIRQALAELDTWE
ncbi:Cytoplasmic dynein 2 heavy chain 1, partial [Armadillidium vulgare]